MADTTSRGTKNENAPAGAAKVNDSKILIICAPLCILYPFMLIRDEFDALSDDMTLLNIVVRLSKKNEAVGIP